jgi:ENTH domain
MLNIMVEATGGSSWSPDVKIMGSISRSALDSDAYYRIIVILHKRLISYDLIINFIDCASPLTTMSSTAIKPFGTKHILLSLYFCNRAFFLFIF